MHLLGAARLSSKTEADQQVVAVARRSDIDLQRREQCGVAAANRGIRIRIDRPQQRRAGAGEILRGQPQAELVAAAVGIGDLAQVAEEVLQFRLAGIPR